MPNPNSRLALLELPFPGNKMELNFPFFAAQKNPKILEKFPFPAARNSRGDSRTRPGAGAEKIQDKFPQIQPNFHWDEVFWECPILVSVGMGQRGKIWDGDPKIRGFGGVWDEIWDEIWDGI